MEEMAIRSDLKDKCQTLELPMLPLQHRYHLRLTSNYLTSFLCRFLSFAMPGYIASNAQITVAVLLPTSSSVT